MKNFLRNNERGSILVITLGLIVVFTMLGLASIELAGLQNADATTRLRSEEAFWLADGAVERAAAKLPALMSDPDDATYNNAPMGDGAYTVASDRDVILDADGNVTYAFQHRWAVDSSAVVDGQRRGIHAVLSRITLDNVITTRGPIKDMDKCPMASLNVDCSRVEENVDFTFETVFPGISAQYLMDNANYEYTDPDNNEISSLEGITIVTALEDGKVQVPNSMFAGTGFVYFDCSAVDNCEISFEGGDFTGIIWVKGEAKLAGNPVITGSIFIEGAPGTTTAITGNGFFTYDPEKIEEAISLFGDVLLLSKPAYVVWKEI